MPRLVAVEECPRCAERALVAGACRACGHLEPEVLERCDGALPPGAARMGSTAWTRRRWILGRGLVGAFAAGPLAVGVLLALVLAWRVLPLAAAVLLASAFAALAWLFACMLVNATTIEVREGRLSVRHGPLPLPGLGHLAIPASRIERLAMRQVPAAGGDAGSFVLEAHGAGAVLPVHASADREEVARLLRFLREALAPPRRRVR